MRHFYLNLVGFPSSSWCRSEDLFYSTNTIMVYDSSQKMLLNQNNPLLAQDEMLIIRIIIKFHLYLVIDVIRHVLFNRLIRGMFYLTI